MISQTNTSAIVFVLILERGKASTHLVKQSVTTKRYLFPKEEIGEGPQISIWTLSKGNPTL